MEYNCSDALDSIDCLNSGPPYNSIVNSEETTNGHHLLNESYYSPDHCLEGWKYENDTICEDPLYFSYSYRIIGTLFQGIIFLVGVFGNLMVVVVVARTKSMHSPTNCYLVSLAIADTAVLIASIPQEIVSYYIVGNQWIWGDVGCALLIFSQNLGINASSLSLAAFTVERYIAICKPFLAQTVCTVNRALRITVGVWIFAFIYCFPWLFLTSTSLLYYKGFSRLQTCEFKLSRDQYLGYYFTDLIVFYVIPLILSVVLYSLIARILYQSHAAKSSNSINGPLSVDSSKTYAARVQVVKMLVMVVLIFAVLWLPYRGLLVYNSFAKEKYMDLWFLLFAKTCVFINSALNPIVYNAMSRKFRIAFGRFLSCGKNRDSYGRYPNYHTQAPYATASTAIPSTATLSCQIDSNRKSVKSSVNIRKLNDRLSEPSSEATQSTPLQYFAVLVEATDSDTVHECPEGVTQL